MSKYDPYYIEPEVRLIENIPLDSAYQKWLDSRDVIVSRTEDNKLKVGNEVFDDESKYKERVMKMGLQYTNFPTYTFEVVGSTLFRDLLFNLNKCPQWATSLRFVNSTFEGFNVKNYPVSAEYKGIKEWEDQFDRYMDKIQETMITDENRVEMPYSMSSKYWIQMNWKTLIGFLSMLNLKMPFFYDVYGRMFINELSDHGIDVLPYLTNYVDASIDQYFRKSEEPKEESFTRIGDTIIMDKKMGLLLYSQFIRQQDTIIKGYFDMLVHDDTSEFEHKVFYASTPIMVSYVADYARFMRTVSNRTCYFSMSSGNDINSWSSILDLVIADMSTDEIKKLLPCKFCDDGSVKCKYYDDIKFREEGIEKRNLPCSIFYKNLDYAKARYEYDGTNLAKAYYKITEELVNGKLS